MKKIALIARQFTAPIHPWNQKVLLSPLWTVILLGVLLWSDTLFAQITVPRAHYLNWNCPEGDYPLRTEHKQSYTFTGWGDGAFEYVAATYGGGLPRADIMSYLRGYCTGSRQSVQASIHYYFGIFPKSGAPPEITQVPVHIRLRGHVWVTGNGAAYAGAQSGVYEPLAYSEDVFNARSDAQIGTFTPFVTFPLPTESTEYDVESTLPLKLLTVYSAGAKVTVSLQQKVWSSSSSTEAQGFADPLIEIDPAFPQKELFTIVFSENLYPPQLSITRHGTNTIVAWPTNHSGFTLQNCTNPGPSAVWSPVPIQPVRVDGQNVITNLITEPNMFFRLFR